MKTDDLIKSLTADAKSEAMPLDASWRIALGLAIVAAALAFFAMLDPRQDIAEAAQTARFLFKFVVTISLAACLWFALRALSRPQGGDGRTLFWLVAAAPLLLAAALIAETMAVPSDLWMQRMVGSNSMVCLTFIPLIGLAPLAVFVMALRHGAPTRPSMAGALAGVLAGGIAATFYAAHCIDDSPLFMAVWYTLAIAVLAAVGALAGRLFVRW